MRELRTPEIHRALPQRVLRGVPGYSGRMNINCYGKIIGFKVFRFWSFAVVSQWVALWETILLTWHNPILRTLIRRQRDKSMEITINPCLLLEELHDPCASFSSIYLRRCLSVYPVAVRYKIDITSESCSNVDLLVPPATPDSVRKTNVVLQQVQSAPQIRISCKSNSKCGAADLTHCAANSSSPQHPTRSGEINGASSCSGHMRGIHPIHSCP